MAMKNPIYKPGQYGTVFINDTNPVVGKFWAIDVVADAVFTTLTDLSMEMTHGAIAGVIFRANGFHCGAFEEITLASGTVIAHKSPSMT